MYYLETHAYVCLTTSVGTPTEIHRYLHIFYMHVCVYIPIYTCCSATYYAGYNLTI